MDNKNILTQNGIKFPTFNIPAKMSRNAHIYIFEICNGNILLTAIVAAMKELCLASEITTVPSQSSSGQIHLPLDSKALEKYTFSDNCRPKICMINTVIHKHQFNNCILAASL